MNEYKLNQPKYTKITKQDNALKLIGGTSLKDRLVGFNYKQLVAAFGEPTFPTENGDGKIQKQWVFVRTKDNVVFTIYDWKTYDENFTTTMLQDWNIGSTEYAGEFVTDMITYIKKKN